VSKDEKIVKAEPKKEIAPPAKEDIMIDD